MRPAVRITDPATSKIAAAMNPEGRVTDRERCLAALAAVWPSGMTDFELADALSRQQTSIGKRRGELAGDHLVEASGLTRPAPSGAPAIVWRCTNYGVQTSRRIEHARLKAEPTEPEPDHPSLFSGDLP